MKASFSEFKEKEIINIKSGEKIGYVDDIVFDTDTERISSLIVFGHFSFWRLFKREDDIVIPWEDIEIIGEDAILISKTPEIIQNKAKKPTIFDKLF